MLSTDFATTTCVLLLILLSSVQGLPQAHKASENIVVPVLEAAVTPSRPFPTFTFNPETTTPAPIPTSPSAPIIATRTPSPIAPTQSLAPSPPVVPANSTKPVYRIDICNTENRCAEVHLIADDCRLLRTPLDAPLLNVTVYKPAVCILTATTNCSMYGNLEGSDPSLFTALQVDGGDGSQAKNVVRNVGAVFPWRAESVVCGEKR